ncbi:MAG TPA: ROK family protein [Methylophilaceae bacterium]|nr:ROK family protein [Methylophilaceae bacterium]
MTLSAGIDVGGTNLRIGVVENERVIHQQRFIADFANICRKHSPNQAWQHIVAAITDPILDIQHTYPGIESIGIGFPGFIDTLKGLVLQSPNLPGLQNVDLASEISLRIGRPVVVENDAAAAAYGEFRLAQSDIESLLYIGLGTGVGGGLVLNQRPYTGEHGAALEIGHMLVEHSVTARLCGCGNRGCLEQYASASGVSLSYQLSTGTHLDAAHIANLAKAGDSQARLAYQKAGTYLAQTIAHVAKILDVSTVVIGGGLSNAWDLMEEAFNSQLHASLIPVLRENLSVRVSTSSDEAGIIGAALLSSL